MSAPMGLTEPGDAELVAGVLAGDRDSFAAIYDRYADRLHDFCYSMLRDRQDAADAMQDTFVLVAQRLVQLRDPTRLRPWLYAIARSEALRRIRARSRFSSDAEVAEMADPAVGPDRAAEQTELAALVADAATGLSDRDRALLDLHLRQGLEGADLGEAMGISASHAHVLLHRLRGQVERSLGALLIARLGRKGCPELDTLLTGWDGRFSPLIRKRVARHVDRCEACSARRRVATSPWALLSTVALVPAPLYLRGQVLARVELVAHHGAPPPDSAPPPSGTPPPSDGPPPSDTQLHHGGPLSPDASLSRGPRARSRVLAVATLIVAALVATGTGVLGWQALRGGPADPIVREISDPAEAAPVAPTPAAPAPVSTPASVPEPDQSTVDRTSAAVPPGPPPPAGPPAPEITTGVPDVRLGVSPQRIELGPSGRTGTVVLTNRGGGPLRWSATASERWLVVKPASGTLDGGESVPVTLQAAHDGRASVEFDWDGGDGNGGTVTVHVTSIQPDPRGSSDPTTAPNQLAPVPAVRRGRSRPRQETPQRTPRQKL